MGTRGTMRVQELIGVKKNTGGKASRKTERSLREIEVTLAEYLNYLSNIVVFRVINVGETLPIYHETDCLVCSKAGYLKEVEIKRSWDDFLADFKKEHRHESNGCIDRFYYCVPNSIADMVSNKLMKEGVEHAGIIVYDEDLRMWVRKEAGRLKAKKLTVDQRLHLARLGTIRAISLMKKIVKLQTK